QPLGAEVQYAPQGLARLDEFAALRNPQRARIAVDLPNALRDLSVVWIVRIEHEFAPMHCAVGVPGLFQAIRLAAEDEAIRGHALKTAVKDLFGKHRRRKGTEILDKLAALIGADASRA